MAKLTATPQSNQRGIETDSNHRTQVVGAAGLNRTSVGLKPKKRIVSRNAPCGASIEPAWD